MLEEARIEIDIFHHNFMVIFNKTFFVQAENSNKIKFECFSENSVSGLFQNNRKFLKETEFFPNKTVLNFSYNFLSLIEEESTLDNKTEVKYEFSCKKNKDMSILICRPIGISNSYNLNFSLKTFRFRKSLITNYWLKGKGNEVDYVHISNGYCYNID